MNKYLFSLMIIVSFSFLLVGCTINESIEDKNDEEVIEEKDPRENVLNNVQGTEIAVYNIEGLTSKDKKDKDMPYVYSISSSKDLDGTFLSSDSENTCKYTVPYFNMNIEGIDKINYIMKAYCYYISYHENDFMAPGCYISVSIVDDIMGVNLLNWATGSRGSFNFNIDLTDKKVLTFDEMINKLGLNKEDVLKGIKESCSQSIQEPDYIDVQDVETLYNNVISSIDTDTYFYLGKLDMNRKFTDYVRLRCDNDDELRRAGGYQINYGVSQDGKFTVSYIFRSKYESNIHTVNLTY